MAWVVRKPASIEAGPMVSVDRPVPEPRMGRDDGSGGVSDDEHGRARDTIVGEVAQRHVGILEPIRHGLHLDQDARSDGEELLAISPGVGRDAADLSFMEEVVGVVQRGNIAEMDPGDGQRPAPVDCPSATGTISPAGAKMTAESSGSAAGRTCRRPRTLRGRAPGDAERVNGSSRGRSLLVYVAPMALAVSAASVHDRDEHMHMRIS